MAEKDAPEDATKGPDGPSLELPSLGFRRKRRSRRTQPAEDIRASQPAPTAHVEAPPAPPERVHPEPDEEAEPGRRTRRLPTLPQLGAVPATLVTGLLVGLLTVGLVVVSQLGCEVVRGTSSCGNAGFLLLLAVLLASGLLGGVLLRSFGLTEGGSTSFLAMGLVAVVLLLVLGDQLFAWWMVLAVPVVAMGAYLVSHRVTTAMVEPGGPEMHR